MNFEPKSEAEIAAEGLLPDGTYDFEIADASDEISKSSGNEMIKLSVRLFNEQGSPHGIVFDYLLPSIPRKLRNACVACGMLDQYETGNIDADNFVNKCGRVKVGIQKDTTGNYSDKNVIKDYLKPTEAAPAPAAARKPAAAPQKTSANSMADLDDEIPF